jgi:hypothetical protein
MFHSAYSPKLHNSAPSLNMLYTAESAQFNSVFSPTMISLTPRFRRKREVWLPFFTENAQNDPKTHSYEDNAKFHSAFLPTTLSYASRFWRNRGVIENLEYLGEFEEDFRKCWLYCILYLLVIERCKNKFKNRLWKSRACVPLSYCNWFCLEYRRTVGVEETHRLRFTKDRVTSREGKTKP